jgi:hypothetical protein
MPHRRQHAGADYTCAGKTPKTYALYSANKEIEGE